MGSPPGPQKEHSPSKISFLPSEILFGLLTSRTIKKKKSSRKWRAVQALTTSPKRQPRGRGRLVKAEVLGGGGGARGAALLAQRYGSKPFERTGAVQNTSSFHSCSRKMFCVFRGVVIREEKSKARTWRIIGL